ncbi:hypothetical protein [Arthrobacter sp. D3-16]
MRRLSALTALATVLALVILPPSPAEAIGIGSGPSGAIGGSGGPESPGALVPVSPTRMLDTRTADAVGPDSSISFRVAGRDGIPAAVSAVVFNLTVTEAQSYGFISAYASGSPRPDTSNLNFGGGQTVPNLVTVPVGTDGKVTLFNRSSGTTHLIADVTGYYLPGTPNLPGAFSSLTPTRMLDTRTSTAVRPDSSVSFQVAGRNGVPAAVSAVVFNLTVTEAQSYGFISAYPFGALRPDTSNLNFGGGQTVPNLLTVPVGTDGKVTLYNRSSGTTHLIADVAGYYLPGTPNLPGAFSSLAPTRMLDTRAAAAVGPDSSVSFQVAGRDGVPAAVSAVVFNLTVTEAQSHGFISAYPSGPPRPDTSNLNFRGGQTVPNLVTVPVGTDGKVTLFNRSSGTTQLIADVAGYYLPGSAAGSVWTWGAYYQETGTVPYQISGLSGVTELAGTSTKYALLHDGTVRAWGNNSVGQFGNGTITEGMLTYSVRPVQVSGLTDVKSVSASYASGFSVLGNGTVLAWGANLYGILGNGTETDSSVPVQVSGLTGVKSLTTTAFTAYAVLTDGTVRAWGWNGNGQLGNGTTANSSIPVPVPGLTGVKSIATIANTAYAVLEDGSVRSWGNNGFGQLGNGTAIDSNVPVQVVGLSNVVSMVSSSGLTAYAVLSDGTVRAWGRGASGQLGNGTTTSSALPAEVAGLTGVTSMAAGFRSAYAVLGDGTLWAWGDNSQGQLGTGDTINSSVPVQIHSQTSVKSVASIHTTAQALLSDGTVWAWGSNTGERKGTKPEKVVGLSDISSLLP